MTVALRILAVVWIAPVLYGIVHVFLPYTLDLIEEARWLKLHPGLPLSRRRS